MLGGVLNVGESQRDSKYAAQDVCDEMQRTVVDITERIKQNVELK